MIQKKKKEGEAVSASQEKRVQKNTRSLDMPVTGMKGFPKKKTGKTLVRKELSEIIEERLHPTAVEFLKRELGINVSSLDAGTVYDLAAGRVTKPLSVTVRPMVYDAKTKESHEGPELSAMMSLKVNFPHDSEFKPIDITGEKVYVTSYPCYDYLMTDDSESVISEDSPLGTTDDDKKLYEFTENQKQALEGIGIDRDRFYVHSGINPLSRAQKAEILSGEEFQYVGIVRTAYGLRLNVCGTGVLKTLPDGTAKAKMWSNMPMAKGEGDVLDFETLSKNGNIKLDLFRRDPVSGKVMTDIDDRPVISDAAEQLNMFGIALEPVSGYVYNKVCNQETGVMELKCVKEYFQVSEVNGGLCATRLKRIDLKDEKGRTVIRNGKEVYSYELSDVRLKNGKVYVLGRGMVSFPSDAEEHNYRSGKGVFMPDTPWEDPETGKKSKYEAYMISDNRTGGFSKVFGPEESSRIKEYLESKLKNENKTKSRRKAGYSTGTKL